jgi:hypothetical protein
MENNQKKSPEQKSFNRKFAGFKRTLMARIKEDGSCRKLELELEYLKNTPTTQLPKKYFSYEENIRAIEESLRTYKEACANG